MYNFQDVEGKEHSSHAGRPIFSPVEITENVCIPHVTADVTPKHFPEMESTESDPCHILIMEPQSLWFANSKICDKGKYHIEF